MRELISKTANRVMGAALDIEPPIAVIARPLKQSIVQFSRFTSQRGDYRIGTQPTTNAFLVVLALVDNPAREGMYDGSHTVKGEVKRGLFSLVDLSVKKITNMKMIFDNVHMQFDKSALQEIALDSGRGKAGTLDLAYTASWDDVVVRSLGHCLLPAFERPEQANRLFIDHIAMALLTHMATTYSGTPVSEPVRGGLAPWQVRRAKELLLERIDGEVTLEELARECELSRSHFVKAFKRTVGVPSYQWLMLQRIDRAKSMLMAGDRSIAEIASSCGFAHQSHLTRVFSKVVGVPPGVWRRNYQS